jgi:hypothetical protein
MLNSFKNILYIPIDKLLYGSFIYLFFFIGYLELSPQLGNMWLRLDSATGNRRFHPETILRIIIRPLHDIIYWSPYIWDLNFYIGAYLFSKGLVYLNLI